MQPKTYTTSPRPISNASRADRSARKITQSAPVAPTASASAIHGVVTCRIISQPKPADINGASVKTAAVETGGTVFSASNMVTK